MITLMIQGNMGNLLMNRFKNKTDLHRYFRMGPFSRSQIQVSLSVGFEYSVHRVETLLHQKERLLEDKWPSGFWGRV